MSWIKQELNKRSAGSHLAIPDSSSASPESVPMQALWAKFQEVNSALPTELQLAIDHSEPIFASQTGASFHQWLRAPNGAALGFSGNAIRYVWPERSRRKSNNFLIRWSHEQQRYVLKHRVSGSPLPAIVEYRFDERRTGYIIKRLVLGKRVRVNSARKSVFWPF